MTTGSEMSLEVGDKKNSHRIKTELSYKKEDKLKKKKKKTCHKSHASIKIANYP